MNENYYECYCCELGKDKNSVCPECLIFADNPRENIESIRKKWEQTFDKYKRIMDSTDINQI